MSDRIFTDFVSVFEDKLIIYNAPADGIMSTRLKEDYERKTDNKKYTGYLPKSGKKKIEKRLNAWIYSILAKNYTTKNTGIKRKNYPTFVTLTYPDTIKQDDKWLKKNTLELFIKQLQYKFNITHYFWKAEKTKKGTLHFHLLIDRYIDKKLIQKSWNSILSGKGLLREFTLKHGHSNPPSTHIRAMSKRKFPVKYIMKYCYDKEDNQKIDGLVYRFSNSLRSLCNYSNFVAGEISESLNQLCYDLASRVIKTDHCRIILLKSRLDFESAPGRLKESLLTYYYDTYLSLYGK